MIVLVMILDMLLMQGKIKRELGWDPKESFETGIEKTISWYIRK